MGLKKGLNKANGCDEIPAELFRALKDDAIKVLHSLEDPFVATGLEKVNFHPNSQEQQYQRMCYQTIALISHASKVMLNILHARLQHYENQELLDVQDGFRKGRGTRYQIANIFWIIENARAFQRSIYLCFINYTTALTVWIMTKCGKLLER